MKTGVLLINLGTPNAPTKSAVAKYLGEFLFDKRVIELPFLLRALLVFGIIIPTRVKKSTHAYKSIWLKDGSPLLVNSLLLRDSLQNTLGDDYTVALAMRYGLPSIKTTLTKILANNIDKLVIIPLFPQYASATNGSAIIKVLQELSKFKKIIPFTVISNFYKQTNYIHAQAELLRPYINNHDCVLLSYHGLPERQLINPGIDCYRTNCLDSAKLIAQSLKLRDEQWHVGFQSRLGKLPWIKPYTDELLIKLRTQGVKNVLVACPSFVTDCLETLEEIGIRAKEEWLNLGGENLTLVPCLNTSQDWVLALANMVRNNQPSL